MYKVDSARLFRDAAKQKRNSVGAMTGILAGLAVLTATVAIGSDYELAPTAMFIIILLMWVRSARRFWRATESLAMLEAILIKEQDLFEASLSRKMEW